MELGSFYDSQTRNTVKMRMTYNSTARRGVLDEGDKKASRAARARDNHAFSSRRRNNELQILHDENTCAASVHHSTPTTCPRVPREK